MVPTRGWLTLAASLFLLPVHAVRDSDHFVQQELWNNVLGTCGKEIGALSSCPTTFLSRDDTATLYAVCWKKTYRDYFNCAAASSDKGVTTGDEVPDRFVPEAEISYNSTCDAPDPKSILSVACAYDQQVLSESDCCTKDRDCSQLTLNLEACHYEAARQYMRCSSAEAMKKHGNTTVAECVSKNAQKVTWLPSYFLIFSGIEDCEDTSTLIRTVALENVEAIVLAILANKYLIMYLFRRYKAMRDFQRVQIKFLNLFCTLVIQLAQPIVIGILLRQQGIRVSLVQQVYLWSIRPRPAAVIGLLGRLLHPSYMELAIDEMFADLILALPAGAFGLMAAVFPNKTHNPAKPSNFRVYSAGGIIMLIPSVAMTLAVFGSFLLRCAPFRALKYPLRDLKRIVANRFRKKDQQEEPYTVEVTQFIGWYYHFVFFGLLLFVGSWMAWSNFMKMAGELYCPTNLNWVNVVLLASPVLLNILRFIFS